MKNRKLLLVLFLLAGIVAGSVGTYFAQKQYYEKVRMWYYTDTASVFESEAYRCAEYLFCDEPFKQQSLRRWMGLYLELFVLSCLEAFWDYPPPNWDPMEKHPEIFVWFFEDTKRVNAFYKEFPSMDTPEFRERAKILYTKAKAAVEKKKKEMVPTAGEWDFVRKPLFSYHAFSYQNFIDSCDEDLLDEESDLAASGRAEVYLTRRMADQYIAKGCSKKDSEGKYFLYFLIGENRVLACPIDGNGNLYASVTPKAFSQLIISADGSWEIVE